MNEKIISLLRGTRAILQTAAEPVDWIARMLNNKHGYPPLHLRQQVGNLSDFEGSAGEYTAYLKLLCGLKPGDSLLDIGCGCGLICLDVTGAGSLIDYVGKYYGLDIDKRAIKWCQKHIGGGNTYFKYLNRGEQRTAKWQLPPTSSSFNTILAKSLFTHLLIGTAKNYLSEIQRLLKPGGKCLSTWFLLNDEQHKLKVAGLNKYNFGTMSCNGHTAYLRLSNPELGVGYDEEMLMMLPEMREFETEVYYGTWSGRQGGLSFQDIIIIRKER